ncbi:MAG: OmpA family protein [Actinobacteria bacterium]|nr:OmpA family protein [Actinomycetota bacterium]
MSRSMRRAALLVATVLMAVALVGCGAPPDRSREANVVVVATATANEPGVQLPAGFDDTLGAANATHRGSVTILMPRGGRTEQASDPLPVAVLRDGTDPENDPGLVADGLRHISAELTSRVQRLASDEPNLDLLTGLNDAARRAPRATLVAISSGLQTTGLADFTGLGWDFRNSDVIANLRDQGFLPDLSGKKVVFVGLGDTAGAAQAPLPEPMRAKVESLWLDICHAAGADDCTTAQSASTAPTVSTVAARVVAVPVFSLPSLPAAGGSMPMPTEALFAPDSADLLPQAQNPLEALARELVDRAATVDLVGRTWSVGPADTARGLSEQRAKAVAAALVQYGVPRERIGSITGVGYDDPIHPAGADSASTAAANRVVVVTVRNAG